MTAKESASATITENHTPSSGMPKSIGKRITVDVWNTSVRKKEMIADTAPLLSAVKNDEPKIPKPQKRN